jgi:hypothetical protein
LHPNSAATRSAVLMAATRRGCVTQMAPDRSGKSAQPKPASSRNWGTWVVLPHPVSPHNTCRGRWVVQPQRVKQGQSPAETGALGWSCHTLFHHTTPAANRRVVHAQWLTHGQKLGPAYSRNWGIERFCHTLFHHAIPAGTNLGGGRLLQVDTFAYSIVSGIAYQKNSQMEKHRHTSVDPSHTLVADQQAA